MSFLKIGAFFHTKDAEHHCSHMGRYSLQQNKLYKFNIKANIFSYVNETVKMFYVVLKIIIRKGPKKWKMKLKS